MYNKDRLFCTEYIVGKEEGGIVRPREPISDVSRLETCQKKRFAMLRSQNVPHIIC